MSRTPRAHQQDCEAGAIHNPPNNGVDQPAQLRSILHDAYNSTVDLREQPQIQHYKGHKICKNIGTMDETLKSQVIDTVKDTYLKGLKNKYTGILGVTFHDFLKHLSHAVT